MQAKRKVYADNAATTAVSEQVLEAMLPFYKEVYGNPSSLYELGQQAKAPLEQARADVAACLGPKPNEIYFTSCGSESDNWAIRSAAEAMRERQLGHKGRGPGPAPQARQDPHHHLGLRAPRGAAHLSGPGEGWLHRHLSPRPR